MPRSVRKPRSNVVDLKFQWISGKCFALIRQGRRVDVRPYPRKRREPPLPGTGTVVPFPAKVR